MKNKKVQYLPQNILDDVSLYLDSLGEDSSKWYFEEGMMDSFSDIEYWLQNKLKYEGMPVDFDLINQIGTDGKIINPIILDTTNEVAVKGRHRLTAAQKFKLTVPVVCIFKKESFLN
jgi:hypothetical protein